MDCIPKLKSELVAQHKMGSGPAVKILDLKDPQEGRESLKKMLTNSNDLVGIEAASVLAILGFKDGVDKLLTVQTLTNSQVEYFYIKASLLILGEKIPVHLKNKDSVFPVLNDLIRKCSEKS